MAQLPRRRPLLARHRHWERVRRYAVLDAELTVDEGLVTPNMKVRRDVVLAPFEHTVAGLYDAWGHRSRLGPGLVTIR